MQEGPGEVRVISSQPIVARAAQVVRSSSMRRLPRRLAWLFWDADPSQIDLDTHELAVIPRVLERGRLVDVQWLLASYGRDRVHRFLRDIGHQELSARTISFWRATLAAGDEPWADPRASRPISAAPWIA